MTSLGLSVVKTVWEKGGKDPSTILSSKYLNGAHQEPSEAIILVCVYVCVHPFSSVSHLFLFIYVCMCVTVPVFCCMFVCICV